MSQGQITVKQYLFILFCVFGEFWTQIDVYFNFDLSALNSKKGVS